MQFLHVLSAIGSAAIVRKQMRQRYAVLLVLFGKVSIGQPLAAGHKDLMILLSEGLALLDVEVALVVEGTMSK